MIINDASLKINLCIKELLMIKEILDAKVADDSCSRLLAVYAMIRVDDITKIWGHTIPKTDALRAEYETILDSYNNGLRNVRDKLGAHYQSPSHDVDLIGSVQIFRFIDYANTMCLLDQIFKFQQKKTQINLPKGFDDLTDFNIVIRTLELLYSDDQAHLTNGALDFFGINKGCLMTCSSSQRKGQYLRSIELMVDISYTLVSQSYTEKSVKNLLMRLFICMVYNYHDNLITRNINENAPQYEAGFDKMFLGLITDNDNRNELEQAFPTFEDIYHVSAFIERSRKIRDHACAHISEQSTLSQIDAELDNIVMDELHTVYEHMLNLFNYICNNVSLLKPLALPARSKIFNAQIETVSGTETFYGESPKTSFQQKLDSKEVLRSIRKQDERYDEAIDTLNRYLMSNDESVYRAMIDTICYRLKEPQISMEELSAIVAGLLNARRGDPERLQHDILLMLHDDKIYALHNAHLLWLLSNICTDDECIDMRKYLESIIVQRSIIPSALAILAYLHMTINKSRCCIVANRKAHVVDEDFKRYCKSINTPKEACALMMMLSQRWFFEQEYSYDRSYETYYTQFFETEVASALNKYFIHIKYDDKAEIDLCDLYLRTKHYILLLYRLSVIEEERNQQQNIFMDFWRYNCFLRTKSDMYEALGVGLMTELAGDIDAAREIFTAITKEYPINRDTIRTLQEFNKRNS